MIGDRQRPARHDTTAWTGTGRLHLDDEQRHGLARQGERESGRARRRRSAVDGRASPRVAPPVRAARAEGARCLRRSHPLPGRVGVAVVGVDAEVLQPRLSVRRPADPSTVSVTSAVRPGHVVVVVVPDQDRRPCWPSRLASAATSGRSRTPCLSDACRAARRRRSSPRSARAPIRLNIRNTLSTGRSMPLVASARKPGEVRLVLELERPGQRAFEVDAVPVGEVVHAREAGRRVARVHRRVAVAELRALARRAAVRDRTRRSRSACAAAPGTTR